MTLSPRLLTATGVIAAIGLSAACTTTAATVASADQPFTCELAVEPSGRMVNFEGRIQAETATSGTYRLSISGGGTSIDQGGPFSARAGQTLTLGQAMLTGSPDRYDTTLTVEVDGTRYSCPATDL